MLSIKRLIIIPAVVATCGLAMGCVSYHRTVDETQPATVVEPAPATVVTPAPVVAVPETSSTTTTTESAPGVVERQRTTTYTAPY